MSTAADSLLVTEADIPGAPPPQVELLDPILSDFAEPDEAKATATVATRMKEAGAIVIRTQEDLDDIGRRVIDNKKLQKHFQKIFNWKAIKQDMDAAKAKVLAQEHAVMDPLIAEERHYKTVIGTFEAEQRRIAEERARQEQVAREAEQQRLLAEAEQRRQEEQARINAALALEHAEEVERALVDAEQSGASQEEIAAICETPAPEPVIIPLDIPVLPAAPAAVVPAFTMPKGINSARKKKYVGRLVSIAQLCAAVASGKQPSTLVDANMRNINKIVDASGPAANIPGIRVEEDTSRLPSIRT